MNQLKPLFNLSFCLISDSVNKMLRFTRDELAAVGIMGKSLIGKVKHGMVSGLFVTGYQPFTNVMFVCLNYFCHFDVRVFWLP